MDALASMSIPTLLEEAAKRTKDGSKDAIDELTAAISTPAHQLNYLLSGEMFFQERVLKKAINRIGEELPGDFQVEGAFVDFYKSALASLKDSPRLKPFQSSELSRPREVNWKQAVAEVETMMGEHDTKIVDEMKLPIEVRKQRRKARKDKSQPAFRLAVAGSTKQLQGDVDDLTAGNPGNHEKTVFYKKSKVNIHGRYLSSVDITVHLRGVLPGTGGRSKKRQMEMDDD
ncbi:hypothetical protein RvY_17418 [Ramazzottius varieornatus]|uniref:Uncharacterized protein n=1 Tax=Ramazzottius varieornatus TaxID=947166 RepID=A0A1D1W2G9_RAMVA|nr:hypothetical protein RvY_17418 [Ramazzottius varieornatus]